MPTYEFLCKSCKNEFEVVRPMSATGEPPCPECGSEEVKRRLSLFFAGTVGAKSSGNGGGGGGGSCCSRGGCSCH